MASSQRCGYGCGAEATVDFFWQNDAEVWHVCDKHAQALQKMLDEHEGADWVAQVVRAPTESREFESPRRDDNASATLDECTVSAMGRFGDHLWPLLWRIRNWLTRGR
jgi:hypothetical protein